MITGMNYILDKKKVMTLLMTAGFQQYTYVTDLYLNGCNVQDPLKMYMRVHSKLFMMRGINYAV